MGSDVVIRPAEPRDIEACGEILYESFFKLNDHYHFPTGFTSAEAGSRAARSGIMTPGVFAVVAEVNGRPVGVNFLDERSTVTGVGPLGVRPDHQVHGIGRALMKAVIDRAGSKPVYLLQDSFNVHSLGLYLSLGFEITGTAYAVGGKPKSPARVNGEIVKIGPEHLDGCAKLAKDICGFDRRAELEGMSKMFPSHALFRNGEAVAYLAMPMVFSLNHGFARTESDLVQLVSGLAERLPAPQSLLVPGHATGLLRTFLEQGLRIQKPMTYMARGPRLSPAGVYIPSVVY